MKALTKGLGVNPALPVIQHMNAGMTVVEACRAVGMPRSSFYYILENNPEVVAEVQDKAKNMSMAHERGLADFA